jgi:uncharacterized Zn finger protein (UPF0148 family)
MYSNNIIDQEEREMLKLQREQSQKASQLIGQYLLKGWALIDEICPNDKCYSIPLVRSNDKKRFCVICQNYYVAESDLDFLNYKITTSHSLDSSSKEKHKIETHEIESTNKQDSEKPVELTITKGKNDNNIDETKDIVKQTVSTLFSTLEFLENQLKNSNDTSHIKLVCDSIKSCAQALEVTKGLDHKI